MFVTYPQAGLFVIRGGVTGRAQAGLGSKLPGIAATYPILHDSLRVQVTRFPNPGQDSIRISMDGFARHHNPGAAGNGGLSTLRVTVYPNASSAYSRTGAVASGDMKFFGTSKTVFHGFFSAADFTAPTAIGDSTQVRTVPNLSKTVLVADANAACVEGMVDPDAEDGVLPTSTPLTLAVLASLLLGGGTWFMLARGFRRIA